MDAKISHQHDINKTLDGFIIAPTSRILTVNLELIALYDNDRENLAQLIALLERLMVKKELVELDVKNKITVATKQ